MSLITRCPTCETMFRVVPDQLRVSEGWVRCGQCAEIFDATQNMVPSAGSDPAAAPAVSPAVTQPPAPALPPEPPPEPRHAPAPAPSPSFFVRPAEQPPTPPPEPPRAQASVAAVPEPNPATASDETGWIDPAVTNRETVLLGQEPEREPEPEPPLMTPEPAAIDLPLSDSAVWQAPGKVNDGVELDEPPVTFLRDSEKPSMWRKPVVRWSLAFVVLVLLALLILQVVRMERDRIAAVEPAMRPMLQALCEVTVCELAPLRQIESVVIDSSSFSRGRGDDYQLGFALRNTAPIAIAMPSIELSLTDPQDQAVIRRVIQPAEFGSGSLTLAKASVWSGSLALSVKPGTHTERIAGYRLLAFYP